ncbi:MAG: PAS domain S-box protein [Gammaproteobacteria bacterium]|nr:PAS domain S-box protein [Gammaproteobacteria bacterium]
MRNNQPITHIEYAIPTGSTLVSKTDTKGVITDCNDAFEVASGYSRCQIIGQPHNLIRHPDVPEAVFADLWRSLKKGNTWSQIVKNRRADGSFYWVRANVTPIYTDGKISGFMSIRAPAIKSEVSNAEHAYKEILAGKSKIKDGRVYKGINWRDLNIFSRFSPQYQLMLATAVLYLIPYIIYSIQAQHNLLEQVMVAGFGLIPPFLLGKYLQKQNRYNQNSLTRIASGERLKLEWFDPETNAGEAQTAIRSVYLAAREKEEDVAYQLDKAQQLQTAMDQISSNIMIADANLTITYMNNEMIDFLKHQEPMLQKFLPHFKVDELLGQNIDIFHANPAHQRGLLNKITEPYTGNIQLDSTHLEIYAIPVYNRSGQRTATVAEWRDKTPEVQLLEEVSQTVKAAQQGLLSQRIDLSKVNGVALELSQSINNLLEAVESPINAAVKVAVSLSEGDLTQHIEGKLLGRFAVLQDSFNVALDNMASMMSQTKVATNAVSGGAQQIYQGSVDLNDRTQNQAASLEQTASSMEQMTAAVKQNADNAQEASQVTQTTASQAKSGVNVMHRAIESMEQIHDSSQKINDIIALIDSIAFQTNLLALNAAVEAARAGEHGRGFAVVAGEVRNLAGKSSEAAKDIRILIEDTVKKVSEGSEHVKGSGEVLNEIVESISNVNKIIEEIALSSNEQSQGVDLVNKSITTIDNAVQQNAALVEETAATAEELGEMSKQMNDNVSQFKINEAAIGITTALQTGNFDFAGARRAHRQWRVKVRAYINDVDIDFNRTSAADGSACALGQWIYGHGQDYKGIPTFTKLEQAHTELHSFIGKILALKDLGDVETANQEMAKLAEASEIVIKLINQLEREMENGAGMMAQHTALEAMASHTSPKSSPKAPPKDAPKRSSEPAQEASTPTLQTPTQPARDDGDEWSDF